MRELAKSFHCLGTVRRRQLERRFPQRSEACEFPIFVAVRRKAEFRIPRNSCITQSPQRRSRGGIVPLLEFGKMLQEMVRFFDRRSRHDAKQSSNSQSERI